MGTTKLFWGLHIESGKAYTQTVNQGFAIRQAVVEKVGGDVRKSQGPPADSAVRVFAKYENADFILCVLSPHRLETSQVPLNVKFETGAQLTLRVEGAGNTTVHLTGYCIPSVSPSTPSSAIAIPFEGQQKSILVSSKKGSEGKKRVSVDEVPNTSAKANNKSVSFGAKEDEDDDDDDDDDEEDDENFIKNGLPGGEDDDEDEDMDEEATTEEDTDDDEDGDGLNIFTKKIAALNKKLQEDAAKDAKSKKGGTQEMEEDEDEDEDEDDEEEGDDDEDDDEDDEDDSDEIDEDDIGVALKGNSFQSTPKASKIPEKVAKSDPTSKATKKNKANEIKTPEGKEQNAGKKSPAELKTPEQNKAAPKAPSSAGHTPMKFVSKGGVMVQELKVGGGPIAKSGKMVTVYYQGRLKSNNKLFDRSDKGPGFKFRLGQGEVIKGWDIGVEGMKVGGKRKLIIPANLAYGKRGAPPDIPPNSTLTFDVELKNVS